MYRHFNNRNLLEIRYGFNKDANLLWPENYGSNCVFVYYQYFLVTKPRGGATVLKVGGGQFRERSEQ